MTAPTVDEETVEHVAGLARIDLEAAEAVVFLGLDPDGLVSEVRKAMPTTLDEFGDIIDTSLIFTARTTPTPGSRPATRPPG